MSPEDQARARLLAHYEDNADRAAERLERVRSELAKAEDPEEAEYLTGRAEILVTNIEGLRLKAKRLRSLGLG